MSSNALPIDGSGCVTITCFSASSPVIADQLRRCAGGAPLVIRDPDRKEADQRVEVTGRADFLNVPNVPVRAVSWTGANGTDLTVRFSLIDGPPGPAAWSFRRSFPDLPRLAVGQPASPGAPVPDLFDSLILSDAAFVLTTASGIDDVTGAPLQPGLNVVAHLAPAGLLGLLGSLVSGGSGVRLYGTVHVPSATELTVPMIPMPSLTFPWQLAQAPPGLSLAADLGVDETVGGLRLSDVGLRIYSPPTRGWAQANPSFSPIAAAAAKLEIRSAGLTLDLTALGIGIRDRLWLFGLFDGLSVANLAKLTDLSGGEDLARLLPDDLRVKLGSLSLDAMSLGLSAPGGAVSLDDVSITVGMPQIDMTVVPGFTIDALNATFDVADPLNRRSARSLNATLGGDLTLLGAPFDVMVTLPEVAAVARLTRPAAISLSSLFDEAGIGMPSDIGVGQLRVAELEVSADKAGAFGFATALAPAPGWSIDLGPVPLTVKDVTVVASRGSGTSSVAINGTIAFGTAFSLAGRYQSPGNFVFRGEIPSVRLSAIVATLTDDGLALPSGFDIDLEGTYARIEKAGADYSFQLATTMASLGTVVLEVRRTTAGGGTWGIATGIDLTGLRLSRLPGLDGLKPFEDVFQLSELIVVVASFADPAFTFPALAAFQGPTLRTGNVNLPAQALGGGVIRGFNVSARWTLDASKQQTLLKNLLGLHASLDITLQVGADPAANSRLFVSMTTKIRNLDFACRFGGAIAGGQIELFLTGILQVPIQGRPTRFDLTLMFVANGAFLSGSMQGTLDFGDLKLSNLALVIGTDWEGLPSLGLAATLDIEGLDSSVAVFFDSTDPSRSLLAGSVSDITLKGVIDKFAGAVLPSTVDDVLDQIALEGTDPFRVPSSLAQSLDNLDLTAVAAALKTGGVTLATASQNTLVVALPGGGRWAVTDLVNMLHYDLSLQGSEIVVKLDPQIYLAPQQTMLGAITFPQGLFFNTGLRLLFLKAQAKVMVRPSQGLLIDGAMDKIVIGTETLFCVSSLEGKTGPVVSGATFAQPQLPEPRRSPHLIVDGSLDLLGIKRAVSVSVTKQGFLFTLKGSIASLLDADLDGTFTGLKALNIGGHLNVGLDTFDLGPLGKITITTGAGGEFRVGVVGEAIGAWFAGSFAFAGQTLTLPRFDLDTRTESLPKLAANVFDLVKTALLDFLKNAERWAKLVADGIISGVKDVEAVLRDTFHKSLDEAKKIVDEVSGKVKTCAMTTAASIL